MSPPSQSRLVRLADESGVGEARRAARHAARALGLDEVATERAAIVATELGRNVVRPAGAGQVVITTAPGGRALDLLALDGGPGIADVARALEDGYSTAGTAGQGLGAVSRASAVFDVYASPGKGTAVLSRIAAGRASAGPEAGAVCVALASEQECGDAWAIEEARGGRRMLVVDGLGHGHKAAEAAGVAVAAFHAHAGEPAERLLATLHAALRATRGAAVSLAEAVGPGTLRYVGIGNITGVVVGSTQVRRMVSLPGTAGHEARSIRAFDHEWPEHALLIMHSDGITSRWDLAAYPGLAQRHPALVAGVLYRDFLRGRDDATVLVVRRTAP